MQKNVIVFLKLVRGCVSSWAFLYGLTDNQNNNQKKEDYF